MALPASSACEHKRSCRWCWFRRSSTQTVSSFPYQELLRWGGICLWRFAFILLGHYPNPVDTCCCRLELCIGLLYHGSEVRARGHIAVWTISIASRTTDLVLRRYMPLYGFYIHPEVPLEPLWGHHESCPATVTRSGTGDTACL
jgi:hypothetical protein